jgi:hypothetical protein
MMSDIMWSHEGSTLEFRQGVREGLELAIKTVEILISDVKKDGKINEAVWLSLAVEWIEDELSMYEVGDEE